MGIGVGVVVVVGDGGVTADLESQVPGEGKKSELSEVGEQDCYITTVRGVPKRYNCSFVNPRNTTVISTKNTYLLYLFKAT